MENNETFGDFTIMDEVVKNLTGGFSSNSGGTDFPMMDARDLDDDEDVVDFDTKNSGGFKDERDTKDEDKKDLLDEEDDEGTIDDEDLEDEDKDDEGTVNKTDKKDTDNDILNKQKKDDSDMNDLGEAEPEIAAFIQEKLFDKLGWELDEKDTLGSIDALVDYMEKIVELNSTPSYANDDIEKLNKFVEDGGDLRDYFNVQGELDVDKLDLSAEFNQKLVIKEYLKDRGYSDDQADKKIKRYDDSGILEEEALEAKDYVQKIRKEKAETLLKDQAVIRKQQEAGQQKFYKDVESYIDKLENVKGIPLNKSKKSKLRDALLKVGPDGQTSYQKKYNENLIKSTVESAFFVIEDDTLVKDMNTRAESKATQNLKKKLETRTKKGKGSDSLDSGTGDSHRVLDVFNNFIKP